MGTVTTREELEARRKLRNLEKKGKLEEALTFALARIKNLQIEGVSEEEQLTAIEQVRQAFRIVVQKNVYKNVNTRVVFNYNKGSDNLLVIEAFVTQRGFGTLCEIMEIPFSEIEESLEHFGLTFPLSLRVIHGVYQELTSEKTQSVVSEVS